VALTVPLLVLAMSHWFPHNGLARWVHDNPRVANLVQLFGTVDDPGAGDRLAIGCCLQQIRSEYGGRGRVLKRFRRAIRKRL
jgi:hypothetical protein